MMQLPVEVWRCEMWERGMEQDPEAIVRWSMVCKLHAKTYAHGCKRLDLRRHNRPGSVAFKTFRDEDVPRLPHGLVWLDLGSSMRLTDACMSHLPRTLKHLSIGDIRKVMVERCLEVLPPGLVTLVLTHHRRLSDDDMIRVPRSLTHLDLRCNETLTDACTRNLPSGLKFLDLTCNGLLTDASVSQLPRSLTHLNIGFLTNAAVEHLPRGLLHLNVRTAQPVTILRVQHLPRGLKHLTLSGQMIIEDTSALSRTLESLHLTSVRVSETWIENLPRGLKYLHIYNPAGLGDACIRHLPRGLAHLHISNAMSLTDACIQHLPRRLKSLHCYSPHFTYACVPDLPPTLEVLVTFSPAEHAWRSRKYHEECMCLWCIKA